MQKTLDIHNYPWLFGTTLTMSFCARPGSPWRDFFWISAV